MTKFNGHSAPSRRSIIKGAGALAAGVAAPAFLRVRSAYAAYPDRPVKIVVANTPGGPSDHRRPHHRRRAAAIDRQDLHHREHRRRRQQYRHGQRRARRTGRLHDPARDQCLFGQRQLYNKIPYDPLKDFVGVSELATSPNTFVVKSDLPAKTMKEFVALARANPDKFNCRDAADRHDAADSGSRF